jgi:hypothetical protein
MRTRQARQILISLNVLENTGLKESCTVLDGGVAIPPQSARGSPQTFRLCGDGGEGFVEIRR